jgi:hypothetical protein
MEDNVLGMRPQFPGKTLWSVSKEEVRPQAEVFKGNVAHGFNTDLLY